MRCGKFRLFRAGQTTENLGTASVRHVAQTEIVVVVEIGALLPTESATPTFVAAPVLVSPPVVVKYVQFRSRCGVCDAHICGHVCTCFSCYRVRCDSSIHRFFRNSSFHKSSADQQSVTTATVATGGDVEVVEIGARTPDVCHVIRLGSTSCFTVAGCGEDSRDDTRQPSTGSSTSFVVVQRQTSVVQTI